MAPQTSDPVQSNLTHPVVPVVHTAENSADRKTFELPIPTCSLKIVSAAYKEGPTGLSLFMFPNGKSYGVVDVRGGSPGHLFPRDGPVDAVVLSGGSLLGLESGTGVSAEIWKSRGFDSGWAGIPLVKGAIIFDYTARPNSFYPDHALGRAATAAALTMPAADKNTFFLGQAGAGFSASCGKSLIANDKTTAYTELAGQGAGFRLLGRKSSATKPGPEVWIAAFVVVNALGHIVDRTGRTVRGHIDPAAIASGSAIGPDTKRLNADELLEHMRKGTALEDLLTPPPTAAPATTISLVVTNMKLPPDVLTQLGRQIHASMGRAIHPFAALFDGDQLWTVSTNEVEADAEMGTDWGSTILGMAGGEAMWDAILRCY